LENVKGIPEGSIIGAILMNYPRMVCARVARALAMRGKS